ncbi:hypothetical protein F4679DRAFT_555675 [Xylaria curta]|nr:hypothetical protein F4679DRAFT_555675 [Xylaria curta]
MSTCVEMQLFVMLDLPDELLVRIFDFVRYRHLRPGCGRREFFSQRRHCPETRDVQNVRLTCRRFYATSSHLLIDYLHVELQTWSLCRLQDISHHPIICKSIRGISVNLATYSSELAGNPQMFASTWAQQHRQHTKWIRSYLAQQRYRRRRNPNFSDISRPSNADLTTILRRCDLVGQAWQEVADSGGHIPESDPYAEALQICQNEYRQRYEDQQYLLESERFVQDIVAALARMPSARHLKFEDDSTKISHARRKISYELSDGPVEIGKRFIRPLSTPEHSTVDSLYNLSRQILGALPDAGIGLDNLEIVFGRAPSNIVLVP